MDIVAGNKLIAKFMGKETHSRNGADISHKFLYDTSWDWLMPVVEKINAICSEIGGELSNHSRDQKGLDKPLDNPKHWKSWAYHRVTLSTDIDFVWTKVIFFIQWYNETKLITQA